MDNFSPKETKVLKLAEWINELRGISMVPTIWFDGKAIPISKIRGNLLTTCWDLVKEFHLKFRDKVHRPSTQELTRVEKLLPLCLPLKRDIMLRISYQV